MESRGLLPLIPTWPETLIPWVGGPRLLLLRCCSHGLWGPGDPRLWLKGCVHSWNTILEVCLVSTICFSNCGKAHFKQHTLYQKQLFEHTHPVLALAPQRPSQENKGKLWMPTSSSFLTAASPGLCHHLPFARKMTITQPNPEPRKHHTCSCSGRLSREGPLKGYFCTINISWIWNYLSRFSWYCPWNQYTQWETAH